jgi:hypothetical protein
MKTEENYHLAKRDEKIKQLLHKNAELRIGRRILMNILELTNEENKAEIEKLKQENDSLRKRNKKFANRLWKQNYSRKM